MPPSQSPRSTWWSVTAFNDEIAKLKDTKNFPDFIAEVFGGLEKAPTTGIEHFQGAIHCRTQIRRSTIKEWLETAHLEPARSVDCLKKYAMKAETSIEPKEVRVNPVKYLKLHDVMILIAKNYNWTERGEDSYWIAVNKILTESPELAGMLQNPSNLRFFLKTSETWKHHVSKAPYSITGVSQPVSEAAAVAAERSEGDTAADEMTMNESANECPICGASVSEEGDLCEGCA